MFVLIRYTSDLLLMIIVEPRWISSQNPVEHSNRQPALTNINKKHNICQYVWFYSPKLRKEWDWIDELQDLSNKNQGL